MIDIQIIRDNPKIVSQKSANKGIKVDIDKLLVLDTERLCILQSVENLRQKRNENSAKMKGGKPDQAVIDEGKQIKSELVEKEETLSSLTQEYETLLKQVPNLHADDVPLGDESASLEIKTYGSTDTGAKDHLDFATERGWVDLTDPIIVRAGEAFIAVPEQE